MEKTINIALIHKFMKTCAEIEKISAEPEATKANLFYSCMNAFTYNPVNYIDFLYKTKNNDIMYFRVYRDGTYVKGTREEQKEWKR